MSRLSIVAIAVFALTGSVIYATAHDLSCSTDGACFPFGPPYYAQRLPKFYPGPVDGLPMIEDFQRYPEGFFGVACIWSRRLVVTPAGPVRRLVRDCFSY
jgi:hypothetical protein